MRWVLDVHGHTRARLQTMVTEHSRGVMDWPDVWSASITARYTVGSSICEKNHDRKGKKPRSDIYEQAAGAGVVAQTKGNKNGSHESVERRGDVSCFAGGSLDAHVAENQAVDGPSLALMLPLAGDAVIEVRGTAAA